MSGVGAKLKFVGYSLSLTRGVEAPLFSNVLGPGEAKFFNFGSKNAFPTRDSDSSSKYELYYFRASKLFCQRDSLLNRYH